MKNKKYFLFNIINLTLGIVCGVIILFYLESSLNYDKYHKKHSQIYRIGSEFTTESGQSMKKALSSERMGPMIKNECPEVISFVRYRKIYDAIVKYNDITYEENGIFFADTSVFDIFSYEFLEGNVEDFLEKKNSIVIVSNLAKKYFGNKNPIGQTLMIDTLNYEVTGVIKNLPENIHLKFDALVSYEAIGEGWFNTSCFTYVLLNKKAKVENIYEKYPQLFDKYMSEAAQRIKVDAKIILEPLADIHFNSGLPRDLSQGNKIYIYIFGIVGLFIVLISATNYINMSTAFSINRTKEIGLKKIFGANLNTLRIYFIFESMLLTFIAFIIGIVIVRIIIDSNYLYMILDSRLQFKFNENIKLLLMALGLSLIVGFLSGLYPAFRLSMISSLGAVSSGYKHKKKDSIFRKSLIIVQFVLSISVLIGVLVMNKQINYINNRDLGFNKENLISIPLRGIDHSRISVLKENLFKSPNIKNAATAYTLPNSQIGIANFNIESESGFEAQMFYWLIVDPDYIETMEMNVVEGRGFDKNINSDTYSAYVVNEAFVKHMSWENGVGKKIKAIGGAFSAWPIGEIIGVLKDFNINSLHNEVEPIVMILYPGGHLHVRMNENKVDNAIQDIRSIWEEIVPEVEFQYSFIDEHISQAYNGEVNQFKTVKMFSIICFILSCLGLIGLSSYMIGSRNKEIAIRKQLGSSISQIIFLLYKDIAILILIAVIIAIPLSHWFVKQWLNSFVFKTNIGIGIYILSSIITFLFGFISVIYHSLKAAYINPVEALKYE